MRKYLIPLSKRNAAYIAAQNEAWRRRKIEAEEAPSTEEGALFITISRQFACGAFPLAEAIAEKLSEESGDDYPWAVYDQELVKRIAEDHQLSQDLVQGFGREKRSEFEESILGLLDSFTPELKVYHSMVSTIHALAMHGRVILVGRGSGILTKKISGGLNIRLIAPVNWRIKLTRELYNIKHKEAVDLVSRMDYEREHFIRKYLNADVADPYHYHMILNNSKMKQDEMVRAVIGVMKCGKNKTD